MVGGEIVPTSNLNSSQEAERSGSRFSFGFEEGEAIIVRGVVECAKCIQQRATSSIIVCWWNTRYAYVQGARSL